MPPELPYGLTEKLQDLTVPAKLRLPDYLSRSISDQLRAKIGARNIDLYKEPGPDQILRNITRALTANPKDRDALYALADNPHFPFHIITLLFSGDGNVYEGQTVRNVAHSFIDEPERHPGGGEIEEQMIWPRPLLDTGSLRIDERTAKQSMAIIGDGAAGMFMGRMRSKLGYEAGATRLFSRSGNLRGIWNQERVVDEGHNTFATAKAWGHVLSATGKRTGKELQTFLDGVGNDDVRKQLLHAAVESVAFDEQSKQYIIRYAKDGGDQGEERFDSVCICTGNRLPRRFDSPTAPMKTNAHLVHPHNVKRWQEQIPPEKYDLYRGTNPVVVGLGNSAMAMIGEFLKMEKQGVELNPVILTHHSRRALRSPREFFLGHDGKPERMFRDRFDLSRIAGDIPEIETRYKEALERGWIVSDVVQWDVMNVNESNFVQTHTRDGQIRQIPNVPMIFALIGYQNDPELMKKLGCTLTNEDGTVDFDVVTHRAKSAVGGDRLYVLGSAASSKHNRNEEVIPGIMNAVGRIAFTDIVAAHRNRPSLAQIRQEIGAKYEEIARLLSHAIFEKNEGKTSLEETGKRVSALLGEIFSKDADMKRLTAKPGVTRPGA